MADVVAEAYSFLVADEDRFLPVVECGNSTKKLAMLHPIFLLKSQAQEYIRNGMKVKRWKQKPRIVKVKLKTI